MQRRLLGIISVDFDATGSATDNVFCIRHMLENIGNTMKQCINSL